MVSYSLHKITTQNVIVIYAISNYIFQVSQSQENEHINLELSEINEGLEKKDAEIMLVDGTVLTNDKIIKDCGLKNGDTIIIV